MNEPLTPQPKSDADTAPDRVIAAEPIVIVPPVSDPIIPAPRRCGMQSRGW